MTSEQQAINERVAAWEQRFTALCAEARLSSLQSQVLRCMLTGRPLHELATELYGVLCFKGMTRQQRIDALERSERQATGLALAGVQAIRRIEVRFPESQRDGARFARDVVTCARNRGSDWAYEPIGGEEREPMASEAPAPTKARLVNASDLQPTVDACVKAFLRRDLAAA